MPLLLLLLEVNNRELKPPFYYIVKTRIDKFVYVWLGGTGSMTSILLACLNF